MKILYKLTLLYVKSFFGSSVSKSKNDNKIAAILKKAIILIIFTALPIGLGAFLFYINSELYDAFAPSGAQSLLFLIAALLATSIIAVFSFISVLSTYYLGEMELLFIALPIKNRTMLTAKFLYAYLLELGISLFFMIIPIIVFSLNEPVSIFLYLYGIIIAMLLPLPVVAIPYLIQIPLFSVAKFLKNRKLIIAVVTVFGVIVSISINLYMQSMTSKLDNIDFAALIAAPLASASKISYFYPPIWLAWKAMTNPISISNLINILYMIPACLLLPAIVISFLSKQYAKSLIGFDEMHVKKLSKEASNSFVLKNIRSNNIFTTLLKREINMLNREPIFILNGPFMVILMPVILIAVFLIKIPNIDSKLFSTIAQQTEGAIGIIIASLSATLLATMTNMPNSALTRDAKSLAMIKSMPIRIDIYMLAKWFHAFLISLIGCFIGIAITSYVLKLPILSIIISTFTAISLSSLINFIYLWLDTFKPKLNWSNPTVAMKQNANILVGVFASMLIIGGIAFLSLRYRMSTMFFVLFFALIPLLLIAAFVKPYLAYAEKKIQSLEL